MASLVRGHDDEAEPDLFSWLWSISWREQLWLLTLAVPVFPLSMAPFELQRRMINHGRRQLARTGRGPDRPDGRQRGRAGRWLRRGQPVGACPAGRGARLDPWLHAVRRAAGGADQPRLLHAAGGARPAPPAAHEPPRQPEGRPVRELGERVADQELCLRHGDEHERSIDHIFDSRIAYVRIKYLLKFLTNLFNHLAPLSVLVIGGWFAIQGRTEVGTVVAFITGFERMADPARQLLAHYRLTSETRVKYALLAQHFRL